MYLLIVLLPLLGAITSGFFGRYIGKRGSQIITTTTTATASLLSFIVFYEVALSGSPCYIKLFTWIDSEVLHANWGLLFDSLTAVMLIVVTVVSTLVHLYSIGYMDSDPHIPRFMSYLSLFTFFMLVLVTSDNLIQMFIGWEGVGLSSYLLINFWHTRIEANKAAMKAMIVNRVGDFGFSLGIFAAFCVFNAVDFATMFATAPYYADTTFVFLNFELNPLTVICVLLFVGSVGKSAQLGLHTWLPDAMEGPTPVSALIHAATMVTAGVFLIIRCSPIFEYAPDALLIVTLFGSLTAFFAAVTGMLQNDLKRVIAYSTCSQLGYMVFICGLSNYSVSMFHLMNHAFFKALLFLSAGSVIHAISDEQDMRKMGGLLRLIPFTYVMMLIGSLSLMGFPFLTGFYSKDVILELAYAKYNIQSTFAYWLGVISAFFTSFYSIRLIYLTFITNTNTYRQWMKKVHDAPLVMAVPLIILAIGSIFVGYYTRDMFIGLGTTIWGNSIFILPENLNMIDSEFIPVYIKLVPVVFSLAGAGSAFILNYYFTDILYALKMDKIGYKFYSFLNQKWYFDKVYNHYIVNPVVNFGYKTSFKLIDRGLVEMLGPYGISLTINNLTKELRKVQSGYVYHYALLMLLGLTLLITLVALGQNASFIVDYRYLFIYVITMLAYHYSITNKTSKE